MHAYPSFDFFIIIWWLIYFYPFQGYLHLKIAECYVFLGERVQAIEYFHKGIHIAHDMYIYI